MYVGRKLNIVRLCLRISHVIVANYARELLSMLKVREETCRSTNLYRIRFDWLDMIWIINLSLIRSGASDVTQIVCIDLRRVICLNQNSRKLASGLTQWQMIAFCVR